MALQLVLNGQSESFAGLPDGATLVEVIAALALKADRVAVEQNGEIVPRAAWAQTPMRSGDKLEVVHFVGGGCAGPAPAHCGGLKLWTALRSI